MCEKCVRAIEDLDITAVVGNAVCTPAMEAVVEMMQAACVAEIQKTCVASVEKRHDK